MLRVLKPENKHICINARGRKPANKLVQVVDDGGMNRAPREGKASAGKLNGGLKMLRQCLCHPSCRAVPGACPTEGPAGDTFQQNEGLQVAHMWDEAMPAQLGLVVPSYTCQPRAEGGEGNSQRGSGDLSLGEHIYNRSGAMQHLGETQHHLAGGSHASQINQVTKRGEQSNVLVMEQ